MLRRVERAVTVSPPETEPPRLLGPGARGIRWILLGAASGVLAGLACAAFLSGLTWATETRLAHGWLLWLLPLAGFVVGGAYHRIGGRAALGSGLLIDEIHQPT